MPLEPLGNTERIARIRQKIMAATPLPAGSAASDSIDADAGRIWRTVDGCCGSSPVGYRASYVGLSMAPGMKTCTPYYFLGTPTAPTPLPPGTLITVVNNSGSTADVTFERVGAPTIIITVANGASAIYSGDNPVFSVYAVPTGSACGFISPITYTLFPAS